MIDEPKKMLIDIAAPKLLKRALPQGIDFDFKSNRFRSEKTGQYVAIDVVEKSVLTPKSTILLSNNLTLLEAQFLRMSAYSKNITTMRRAELEDIKDNARETTLEASPVNPVMETVPDESSGMIAGAINRLVESFEAKKESIVRSTARAIMTIIGLAVLAKMLSSTEAKAQESTQPTPLPTSPDTRPGITPESGRRVDTAGQAPQESYPAVPSNIDVILRTIRKRETGSEAGNYTVHDTISGSTASGAYQFTDSTWRSLATKYGVDISTAPRAYMAPPNAQDFVARRYVEEILSKTNGDVSMVPVVWLTGNYQGIMSAQGAAINPSVEEYRRNWMRDYSAMLGATGEANLTPEQLSRLPQLDQSRERLSTLFRAPARGVTSKTTITSRPGMRTHPKSGVRKLHAGYDLAGTSNSPVRVVASGSVSFAGVRGGYGNVVIVKHDREGRIETRYAHLNAINVTPGQSVSAGDIIGLLGSTGESTGPHLHFEYRVDGQPMKVSGDLEQRLPMLLVPDTAPPQASAADVQTGRGASRPDTSIPRMAGLTQRQVSSGVGGVNKQQPSISPAGEYARYLGAGVAHA
jgi:murein DD-endopeptidase MepM/ murein hydrolase activator NlpD